jgi:hypothetical protein
VCGRLFTPSPRGRLPTYCSPRCRQSAYAARRRQTRPCPVAAPARQNTDWIQPPILFPKRVAAALIDRIVLRGVQRLSIAAALLLVLSAAILVSFTLYASAGTGETALEAEHGTTAACGAPVNLIPPTITGTVSVGATLHVSTGRWTCDPSELRYAWSIPSFTGMSRVGQGPDFKITPPDPETAISSGVFFVTVTACNMNGCGQAYPCIRQTDPFTPTHDQNDNPIIVCND